MPLLDSTCNRTSVWPGPDICVQPVVAPARDARFRSSNRSIASRLHVSLRAAPTLLSRPAVVDRRRAARYTFCAVTRADLSFVQDAVLESFDGKHASVVTSQPATPGDEVVMVFRAPGETPVRCVMHVCSSTPITWGPSGGYRLELRAAGASSATQRAFLAHL